MSLEKIGYRSVATTDGPTQLKTGPSGFFGFVVSVGISANQGLFILVDGASSEVNFLYT